jgi:hypothetical protein
MGDNYNDITNGFKNDFTASKFDIQKVMKFNYSIAENGMTTTNVVEYQDKQFKTSSI